MPRASPVSVYLFPGEGSKCDPSIVQGDDSELNGLLATATEAQADMVFDEDSEGSNDNDDFCILEAPGMGIPVSHLCPDYHLPFKIYWFKFLYTHHSFHIINHVLTSVPAWICYSQKMESL